MGNGLESLSDGQMSHQQQKNKKSFEEIIQQNKKKVEMLDKRDKLLEQRMKNELALAEKYVGENDEFRAKLCLNRRRDYEGARKRIFKMIRNLDVIRNKVEEQILYADINQNQKDILEIINFYQKKMDGVTGVEQHMQKVREACDDVNEIGNIMGEEINDDSIFEDEEDLDQQMELLRKKMSGKGTQPLQPQQPQQETSSRRSENQSPYPRMYPRNIDDLYTIPKREPSPVNKPSRSQPISSQVNNLVERREITSRANISNEEEGEGDSDDEIKKLQSELL